MKRRDEDGPARPRPPAADGPPGRGADDDRSHQALDARLLRRLWSYLMPYRRAVMGCFALTLGLALLRLSQPLIIRRIIGEAIGEAATAVIGGLVVLFLTVILAVLAGEIIFNYATAYIGQRSMHDLRMAIFRRVAGLDVAYFDRTPVGRLLTRMTSDVSALSDLFTTGVIALVADLALLLGLLGVMFYFSPPLTLVVLAAGPFMFIVLALFRRYSRRWYLETRGRLARLNAFLQENLAGMATVQAFNRQGRNLADFTGLNDLYRQAQVKTILAFALFFPALNICLYLTLTGVIWLAGGRRLEAGAWGGGPLAFETVFLFVQCVNMLFTPLRNLSERYNVLQAAMAASARIFRLLDETPRVVAAAQPRPVAPLREGIVFERVGFEYVAGEPILHEVSFELRRGTTVAVVGATGSGKSTLVNLMTRFYDPTAGRILFDGTDIRAFDPVAYRRLFAVVLQEVFLFSDTVAENLRLTGPELSDGELWELLRQVHADDFVRGLPRGLATRLNERASRLSTGQKQLLAFARALAAQPEILILDEATANVDSATERRIQDAIARLLEGRTAFVVAHRLSTIQNADLILVMHKGRLREAGAHEELLARDGLYRRLYELQFRPQTQLLPVVRAVS